MYDMSHATLHIVCTCRTRLRVIPQLPYSPPTTTAYLLPYSSMRCRAAATCCSTRAPTVAPSARSLAVTAPSTRAGDWGGGAWWGRWRCQGMDKGVPTQGPLQFNQLA